MWKWNTVHGLDHDEEIILHFFDFATAWLLQHHGERLKEAERAWIVNFSTMDRDIYWPQGHVEIMIKQFHLTLT